MNITGDPRIVDAMRALLSRKRGFENDWFMVTHYRFSGGGGSAVLSVGPQKRGASSSNIIAIVLDPDTYGSALPPDTLVVYHPGTCPKECHSRGRNFVRTLRRWGLQIPDNALDGAVYPASADLPGDDLIFTPLGPLGMAALRTALGANPKPLR